jgi:hypothetical protein
MPKNHARKNQLAALKEVLGVKHADAIALLDHPEPDDRAELAGLIDTYTDVTTYKAAVFLLEQERNDPLNQIMCETCGWTVAMVCPECPGCGCYNRQCTGWRHEEYMHQDELADKYACEECGGDTRNHYECSCGEDE